MQPPPPLPADAALFLDFDGTLVEIAPTPDGIAVPTALPDLLARLHDRLGGALAIVSGRGVADLRRYLPGFPGAMIGGHGAEAHPPTLEVALPATDLPDPAPVQAALQRAAGESDGFLYEPKTHGGVLHYRADPSLEPRAWEVAEALVADHPGFALQRAKMAVELKPAAVGKDKALAALLTRPPWAGRTPVYAGDDTTDEPAMALVQQGGGFGIKIGDGDTVATRRLATPADLAIWLTKSF